MGRQEQVLFLMFSSPTTHEALCVPTERPVLSLPSIKFMGRPTTGAPSIVNEKYSHEKRENKSVNQHQNEREDLSFASFAHDFFLLLHFFIVKRRVVAMMACSPDSHDTR
jgi:hypothetical protein